MILKIADWVFDIDMERTMAYSAAEAAEHCDCAYCRNFYASVDDTYPELRPFLAQFGIDIGAPYALYPYDAHQNMIWYEGEYIVFGSILRRGKIPIFDSGMCLMEPVSEDEYDIPQPYFVLSMEGAEMFWILPEPMAEVLSPANEPSFLKKMWDRLLGKAKKSDMES